MTDFTKHDWEKRKDTLISILEDTITLLDDISHSFKNDYLPSRISDFRCLCYGYILISKYNINTTLLLFKNEIIYQIHYISRNMFEMVVNLCYMNDDKLKLDKRVERFFDYTIVQRYNILGIFKHVPELPQDLRDETYHTMTQNDYDKYKSQYNIKNKKFVTDWSGFSLYKMIEEISDDKTKNDLLKGYYLLTKINNQYVHPSIQYIKSMIDDESEKKVNHSSKGSMEVSLLESIIISVSFIIEIYLEHFQKNRQTFRKRFDELETRFRNIPSKITT